MESIVPGGPKEMKGIKISFAHKNIISVINPENYRDRLDINSAIERLFIKRIINNWPRISLQRSFCRGKLMYLARYEG